MKCTLIPGIESISGSTKPKFGKRIVFKTYRRPFANRGNKTETRMYLMDKHVRKTPITQEERTRRSTFGIRAQRVAELMKTNPKLTRKEAWRIIKTETNSKQTPN